MKNKISVYLALSSKFTNLRILIILLTNPSGCIFTVEHKDKAALELIDFLIRNRVEYKDEMKTIFWEEQ